LGIILLSAVLVNFTVPAYGSVSCNFHDFGNQGDSPYTYTMRGINAITVGEHQGKGSVTFYVTVDGGSEKQIGTKTVKGVGTSTADEFVYNITLTNDSDKRKKFVIGLVCKHSDGTIATASHLAYVNASKTPSTEEPESEPSETLPTLEPFDKFRFDVDVDTFFKMTQIDSMKTTVVVKTISGSGKLVKLAVTDWSSKGIEAWLTPWSVTPTPTATSTLTVIPSCDTTPGDYRFTVRGTHSPTFESSEDAITVTIRQASNCGNDTTTTQSSLMSVQGTTHKVGYEISGGGIIDVTPDPDSNSLIIRIDTDSDGELSLTLPREIIDAKLSNGNDDDLLVLIDAIEVYFDETTSSTNRILTIPFPAGAEEIEIIGTFVVPEFSIMVLPIFAISILLIIAMTKKYSVNLKL